VFNIEAGQWGVFRVPRKARTRLERDARNRERVQEPFRSGMDHLLTSRTMKTLILVRHAKSSWKDRSLPDPMRPLNKRGRRDAPLMGQRLAEQATDVELMIASPAVRAMETAEAMAEELDYPWDEIVADERLYHADPEDILVVIEEQDPWVDHLMLIGHNPGMTSLVNGLTRTNLDNVPTAGVVKLTYDVERWIDIASARPLHVLFDYPKKRRQEAEGAH